MDILHPTISNTLQGTVPLGIRMNNPGNIRISKQFTWQGQINSPSNNVLGAEASFCHFDIPSNGRRALMKLLLNYQVKDGCRTIWAFIARWAPPIENDLGSYIDDVCLYINQNDPRTDMPSVTKNTVWTLSTKSEGGSLQLILLAQAITHHEQGQQLWSDKEWLCSVSTIT